MNDMQLSCPTTEEPSVGELSEPLEELPLPMAPPKSGAPPKPPRPEGFGTDAEGSAGEGSSPDGASLPGAAVLPLRIYVSDSYLFSTRESS